jgi:hypothetical protein
VTLRSFYNPGSIIKSIAELAREVKQRVLMKEVKTVRETIFPILAID